MALLELDKDSMAVGRVKACEWIQLIYLEYMRVTKNQNVLEICLYNYPILSLKNEFKFKAKNWNKLQKMMDLRYSIRTRKKINATAI